MPQSLARRGTEANQGHIRPPSCQLPLPLGRLSLPRILFPRRRQNHGARLLRETEPRSGSAVRSTPAPPPSPPPLDAFLAWVERNAGLKPHAFRRASDSLRADRPTRLRPLLERLCHNSPALLLHYAFGDPKGKVESQEPDSTPLNPLAGLTLVIDGGDPPQRKAEA